MNVRRSTPCVPARREPRQPAAEHEQEQQRLQQRGDDPHAVAREADQLALPDDLDRAQVAAEAAGGDVDPRDRGRRGRRVGAGELAGRHRAIILAKLRLRSLDGRLGVADRGAGVGHEHVVERRPGHAHRLDRHAELGEQPRHELARRSRPRTSPGPRASSPRARSGRAARRSPRRRRRSRSARGPCPTLAFSASGVSSTTISPLVHDRDPVAVLGLVHVVRREEDRDVLARLELADVAPDRAARLRVEADRRLVEEQHARRVQQAAGDLQAALHAAARTSARGSCAAPRARPSRAPGASGRRDRGLAARRRARRGSAGSARRSGSRRASCPGRRGRCCGGPRRARRRRRGRRRVARAAGRAHERAEHVDRRRLARAVGPEEAEDLARRARRSRCRATASTSP